MNGPFVPPLSVILRPVLSLLMVCTSLRGTSHSVCNFFVRTIMMALYVSMTSISLPCSSRVGGLGGWPGGRGLPGGEGILDTCTTRPSSWSPGGQGSGQELVTCSMMDPLHALYEGTFRGGGGLLPVNSVLTIQTTPRNNKNVHFSAILKASQS